MTRIAITLAALALAGCQEINCYDNATCSDLAQTRGGQSTSGEIAAEVRDVVDAALEDSPVNVQGGSAGNQESTP